MLIDKYDFNIGNIYECRIADKIVTGILVKIIITVYGTRLTIATKDNETVFIEVNDATIIPKYNSLSTEDKIDYLLVMRKFYDELFCIVAKNFIDGIH